jgi:chromate transport protein ChrA
VEWLVGIALVAALIVVRHVAIRRIAGGDGRFVWIYFAPTLLVMSWLIWMTARLGAVQPVTAILLAVVGAVSLLLFSRVIRQMATDAATPDAIGELSPPLFDYIVWTALGVPVLFIAGLLILLLSGALGKAN